LEELTLEATCHRQLQHSPPPPSLHPTRSLGTTPAPNPTAAASVTAGAVVAPRSSSTPPNSRLGVPSPSTSLQGAGPPSTTLGRAPSSCGLVPAILLWRPYLDRRSSNKRSSPNNSNCPSHSCSRISSLLLHLAPLRSANGVRPAPTTPWPASLPRIHNRLPPRSAWQH
jgi:hypothetical protein